MAIIQIRLADELQERLATRLAESSYSSIDEYVEGLICADFHEDEYGATLEEEFLARVNDPLRIELSAFIRRFDERMAARRESVGKTQ